METPAEKLFGTLLGFAFLVLVVMTILTDEDFVFQVQIPLRLILADIGLLIFSWVGFVISVIRVEARICPV